jgi:FtsH-binding integral membrane protein
MEERTVQSIPVMPFALMYGCISAIIGFFIGVFYALLFGAIFASVPPSTTSGFNLGWLSLFAGVAAVIIVPILSFVSGLIIAAIIALVYNFLAPRIGGVKVRFKEETPTTPQS